MKNTLSSEIVTNSQAEPRMILAGRFGSAVAGVVSGKTFAVPVAAVRTRY